MRFLVRAAIFLLVFGGVAEVWLRTVMPASETPMFYQRRPATVYRFDPYGPTTGLYTVGRLCLPGGEWQINGAGWNSSVDYVSSSERQRPLIALFGDSYVEGDATDVDQHVDAYLPIMLPGTDCYAFGLDGWYLEQYVAVSHYAEQRYQPDVLVILIDGADVSDSLRENGVISSFWWQIGAQGQAFKELPPPDVYTASRKALLAKNSALLRYLRYNAKLTLPGMQNVAIAQPVAGAGQSDQASDGTASAPTAEAWRGLLPAAQSMVGRLCAQHPGTPIIFVAHSGDRYLPVQDVASTPLFPDGRAVEEACHGRPQCSFIDLRYAFSRDWAANGVHFEAVDGGHWNAYANRLVARTLADFITENGLLDGLK